MIAGIAGLVFGSVFGPHQGTAGLSAWRFLIWGVPGALLLYGALGMRERNTLLSRLGDISYSLYLTHPMVMTCFAFALKRYGFYGLNGLVAVGALLFVSVLVGFLVYYGVERRFVKEQRRRVLAEDGEEVMAARAS